MVDDIEERSMWEEICRRRERSICDLLLECARLVDQAGQAHLNSRFGKKVATPALMRIVPYLTPEGVRITELATRLDVSKQAVQKVVSVLLKLGFARVRVDPSDHRARLVSLTPAGVRAYGLGVDSLDAVEANLRARLGDDRLTEFADYLKDVKLAFLAGLQDVAIRGEP
jgi:DNA-binding MarR family transcriptional regulator